MSDWQARVKQTIPKAEIPQFLIDLQALVAALREDRPWTLTVGLRTYPALVLDYLDPGPKRDQVEAALGPHGQRSHGR